MTQLSAEELEKLNGWADLLNVPHKAHDETDKEFRERLVARFDKTKVVTEQAT